MGEDQDAIKVFMLKELLMVVVGSVIAGIILENRRMYHMRLRGRLKCATKPYEWFKFKIQYKMIDVGNGFKHPVRRISFFDFSQMRRRWTKM